MKRSAEVCLNSDWGKQGKLFAHSMHCCYQEDLIIRNWCQGVQKRLIVCLPCLQHAEWSCFWEGVRNSGGVRNGGAPRSPTPVLRDLTNVLRVSDQTPGDKLGNFDSHKHILLSLVSYQLGHLYTVFTFVPRLAQRGQRTEKPQVSFKISGWVELTKAEGECRDLGSQAWMTRLKDSCSSQILLGNWTVKYASS